MCKECDRLKEENRKLREIISVMSSHGAFIEQWADKKLKELNN